MNTIRLQRIRAAFAVCALLATSAQAANAPVTVNVDANANRHAISPNIYGVALFVDDPSKLSSYSATLADLNTPLNRYGGNTSSSYNWQLNASNHANDWYFESIGEASATAGEYGDTFIGMSNAGGAMAMLTIPMLDWVAKVGSGRGKLASFSIAKYGAQTGNDWQWYPDAGNGVLKSNGHNVSGNDPNDASTPSDVNLQKSWVQHLIAKWGKATSGGLKYYILDNEHSIWQSTHRDVHPVGPTMDEIGQKMLAYGHMIRNADAGAVIIGPEEYGWTGYLLSGYDQQYGAAHGWQFHPDKDAHGGMDYMPWLLDHMHKDQISTGKRILNVFSLHYYPQGGEFSNDVSTAMQLLRNQSTRSLWDPNYVDQSWVNDKIDLIPLMKKWVATYYPNTKIGITEYNWGAEDHINGATAQADVFGIFGAQGVDYATRWTTPDPTTPTYKAMKMYRNYDGNKSGFGDTSVKASGFNRDHLAAYAAVRSSDGALTVMVISKVLTGNTHVTVNLAHFAAGTPAQEWQLTSANAITRLANVGVSAGSFVVTVPPQSISLFVVPPG